MQTNLTIKELSVMTAVQTTLWFLHLLFIPTDIIMRCLMITTSVLLIVLWASYWIQTRMIRRQQQLKRRSFEAAKQRIEGNIAETRKRMSV